MSGKFALVIANTDYIDPGLARLSAPGKDAEDLARVLRSPDICAFDSVEVVVNQPEPVVRDQIDAFFDQKKPDDLLVLYFSGHGVRDEQGALYLAVKSTNRYRLRATAVKSDFIRECMDQSRSRRQVLILDCCNSGAFALGSKAATGGSVGTGSAFEGRGYGHVVLTASDSTQLAWEGEEIIGETQDSLFTHFLVKGLQGDADLDGDGRITINELYDYAYEQIVAATPRQTPSKWSYKEQGEIVLRDSIPMQKVRPASLSEELLSEIGNAYPEVRLRAVLQLAKLVEGKHAGLARSAREALERMESEDDSKRVSQAAAQALMPVREAERAEEERRKNEENQRLVLERAKSEELERQRIEVERLAMEAKEEAARTLARQKAEAERIAQASPPAAASVEGQARPAQQVERRTPHIERVEKQRGAERKAATGQYKMPRWAVRGAAGAAGAIVLGLLFYTVIVPWLRAGSVPPSVPAQNPTATPGGSNATMMPAGGAPLNIIRVGLVTDVGGVDDKSFNASAWKGIQDATHDSGILGRFLESRDQPDYAKNIQQLMNDRQDLIITVGFLLGVDTALAAKANPNTKFAIVDYTYPDCPPQAVVGRDCGSSIELLNVRGLTFQTDQAGFLAGYAAAGMTRTAKVGTFGGVKIPTVTIFMKGYEAGVKYYNQQNNKNVEVLGWNTAQDDGLFTGNFDSTEDGRKFAESLIREGADVIMPVAGPVGLGSAAVCKETGKCWIIGVDNDWYISAPEYKEVVLTSVVKRIDMAVLSTIKDVVAGKFTGGTVVYTIADGGVDIAPFHDFDSRIPPDLRAQMDAVRRDLAFGTLSVDAVLAR